MIKRDFKAPLILLLVIVLTLTVVSACNGSNSETLTVEYKSEFDLGTILEDEFLSEVKVYKPDGSEIAVGNGLIFLDSFGKYKMVRKNGEVIYLNTVDTTPPAINVFSSLLSVKKGTVISLPEVQINDAKDGPVAAYSVEVVFNDNKVNVSNNKFTASNVGVYSIIYSASDSSGNKGKRIIDVTVEPSAEFILDSGTQVIVNKEMFDGFISSEAEYSFEYTIFKVKGSNKEILSGVTFTVEDDCYFEVVGTAVNIEDDNDITVVTNIYRTSEIIMLTLDEQLQSLSFFRFTASKEFNNYNGYYKITGTSIWGASAQLLFAPSLIPLGEYTVYADLTFIGNTEWMAELTDGTILTDSGRYCLGITGITADRLFSALYFKSINQDHLDAGATIIVDNIVLVPAE